MAANFEYQVPRFGAAGTGAPTELAKLRINYFWLWCVAANASSVEQGYIVPGFNVTITNPVVGDSTWDDIILDWDGTDTLRFRLTPTWLAPGTTDKTITAMQYEMDTGAGWELLTGPDGTVPLTSENPRYNYRSPDPRSIRIDEVGQQRIPIGTAQEMGQLQNTQLWVMAMAAFQDIYDGTDFRLPGHTTTLTQIDTLTREVLVADSGGVGTFPHIRFLIKHDAARNLPIRIEVYYQQDTGGQEYLMSVHTIEHDGDGRLVSMNRGSV